MGSRCESCSWASSLQRRRRRNMPFRGVFGRPWVLVAMAFTLGATTSSVELTKDEVEFQKRVFVNKKGERLQYRLYVPVTFSKERKYPLVLWLHGGEGRGSDNVRQITKGNEKGSHFWTSQENQLKFSAF